MRMERSDRWAGRPGSGQPLRHFLGGSCVERQRQNRFGWNPSGDHGLDAGNQGSRFSGSGRGEDSQRTMDVMGGLSLIVIQQWTERFNHTRRILPSPELGRVRTDTNAEIELGV